MNLKIALVFAIYNKLDYTIKGLSDIYYCFDAKGTDKLPIDIVITDDGSTDGSYEWIRKNYPNIHLLKGDGNLWWSGGINKTVHFVLKDLNDDYILLWNNDVKPGKTYFNNLFQILKNSDSNTIICSKTYVLGTNDIILGMGGKFDPRTGKYQLNACGQKDSEHYNKSLLVDWFPGMGTTIHKNVFNTIGLFDDKVFPQYHGDSDFGLRAKKAGFDIIIIPELKIWNDRSNTGFSNDDSFGTFIKSLFTLRSNFNICREIKFYNRHATSILAYTALIRKYFLHIGGYIKWKTLSIFGFRRNSKTNT